MSNVGNKVALGDPLLDSINGQTTPYASITSASHVRSGSNGRGHGTSEGVGWKPSVFDFKSSRSGSTCPTCKGSGRIPKGQEDELVALIPYNDKRLKPRRTCLYVTLMAILLMLAGAILTAFLYPRSVVVNIIGLNGTAVNNKTNVSTGSFDNDSLILLGVQTTINIRNSNFYPVTVSAINVSLMYYQNQVGLHNYPSFSVQSRSSKSVEIYQIATFQFPQSEKIHLICKEAHSWSSIIFLKASILAQYSYLMSETSTSLGADGQYINCSEAMAVMTAPTFAPLYRVT